MEQFGKPREPQQRFATTTQHYALGKPQTITALFDVLLYGLDEWLRLVGHGIGLRISQRNETVELEPNNLRQIFKLLILRNGIVELTIECRLMLKRPFLGMRHAGRVAAEMVNALVEEMWRNLRLEYQTDIHYHVFLTVNVARKVEHVFRQQTATVELSPWSWRITPPEICALRQSSIVGLSHSRLDGSTVNPTTISVPCLKA